MRLLLDTHIWLWLLLEPQRVSKRLQKVLASPSNQLWLSPLSVWEALMLSEKGRVELVPDPFSWIETALKQTPLSEATLTHEVSVACKFVALPHRDPVDRLLAATARAYGLALVTADKSLQAGTGYQVFPYR